MNLVNWLSWSYLTQSTSKSPDSGRAVVFRHFLWTELTVEHAGPFYVRPCKAPINALGTGVCTTISKAKRGTFSADKLSPIDSSEFERGEQRAIGF